MGHFCAALCAFAGYCGCVFCTKFPQSHSSLDYPASIFSLPPSADCVLLWTAISSRLFSSTLLCQLTLSVFSGTFLPSSTSVLPLRPFVWVSRQNRQRDPLSGTKTNGNEYYQSCHRIIRVRRMWRIIFSLKFSDFN